MNEYITPEMIQVIVTVVILPILVIMTKQLTDFIKLKGDLIKKQIKNEHLNKYFALGEIAIETAVNSVSQTYVKSLKDAKIFTPEANEKALKMAKEQAFYTMNQSTRDVLTELYGDLDKWLENRIESKIKMLE